MSEQSDSQNKYEEQVNLSEGTSPSSSYDDGSRSTLSNLPKAATRQRRKKNSDSEDEDFVVDEEVTSKKKVAKKEYGTTASTKPGMKVKAPAKRVPMSKSDDDVAAGKKKKRARTTTEKVLGRPTMVEKSDEEEDEEEDAAPAPKAQKLMGDAIKYGATPSKPKTAPKTTAQASKTAQKRSTRNIPAAEKNKAPVPEMEEEEEAQVLRKLKPKIPDHDDTHPVAENMKLRKDACLILWRQSDPYAARRRTAVDYRFHTKEQQNFYETMLLDNKPIVCDMKWVDWKYIDSNEDHFPGVHESFRLNGVDTFVGQKLTKWNDELIMQFYSTSHFYPDGKLFWMSEVPAGKLLGFLVSNRGIEANPEKIKAITTLAKPKCVNDIQRLAGRVAALSRFISRDAANTVFEDLKRQLAGPPVLAAPVDKEPLLLYVAANTRAVSVAVVVERKEVGKEYLVQRPVYYMPEEKPDNTY
ncbi:uncharacterized protein [Aegilops tauschii subsp. strangulata]|uniref:uncharacterized protein n=1 Tax=Aegilops tauschii subsp. strangulata TaxID=200361 RepID=UPI003CC8AFD4